jgi:UrcA family protein
MTKLKTHFAIALALGAAGQAGAAQPTGTPPKINVRYSDLDLSSARGQQILDQRIHRAASHVCERRGSADLVAQLDARSCVHDTYQRAQQDVRLAMMKSDRHLASR